MKNGILVPKESWDIKWHSLGLVEMYTIDGLCAEPNFDYMFHRLDGPAITYKNPDEKFWVVNGRDYASNKSFQLAAGLSDEDMLAIVLKYGDIE